MSTRDVIVIGGGPAGSTAAALLAREGLDVLPPRSRRAPSPPRRGEPPAGDHSDPAAQRCPAQDRSRGFWPKTGSTHLNWGTTPRWDLWFCDGDAYDHAWLVERAKFDAILFDHATECGADTPEREAPRARSCSRGSGPSPSAGASGVRPRTPRRPRDGSSMPPASPVCSAATRRHPSPSKACSTRRCGPTSSTPAPYPLPASTRPCSSPRPTSGGGALDSDTAAPPSASSNSMPTVAAVPPARTSTRCSPPPPDPSAKPWAPTAKRCTDVRSERDWSYRCPKIAGPGWLAIGDAAGFIDPVLSTGVMLALHSAYHAATTILDLHRGTAASEPEALAAYRSHHAEMFGDLMQIVRFFYRQNLARDDYFWESKRILSPAEPQRLRPQKAFLLLTSGLIQNLALQSVDDAAATRRYAQTYGDAPPVAAAPDHLDFLCLHLRHDDPDLPPPPFDVPVQGASVYLLLEPPDPAAPTLFRTRNFHLNVIAPRYGNDPISVPKLEPVLRHLHRMIDELDADDGITLAQWWQKHGDRLRKDIDQLPEAWSFDRAFGE